MQVQVGVRAYGACHLGCATLLPPCNKLKLLMHAWLTAYSCVSVS